MRSLKLPYHDTFLQSPAGYTPQHEAQQVFNVIGKKANSTLKPQNLSQSPAVLNPLSFNTGFADKSPSGAS